MSEYSANIQLLNGSKAARVKSSDGVTVLACGCAHSEREWSQMCYAHYQEWRAVHVDAQSNRKVTAC